MPPTRRTSPTLWHERVEPPIESRWVGEEPERVQPDHRYEPAGPGARSEVLPVRLPNPVLIASSDRIDESGRRIAKCAGPRTGCSPARGACILRSCRPSLSAYGIPLVLTASALIAAQTGPGNNYVDARICAGCHSEIARNYLQTGMGRSLYRPAPANTLEDYARNNEFYHSPVGHALLDGAPRRPLLPAPLASRFWRQRNQHRGIPDRLRSWFRQPRPLLPPSYGTRDIHRTAARLVFGEGRLLGNESRVRFATSDHAAAGFV